MDTTSRLRVHRFAMPRLEVGVVPKLKAEVEYDDDGPAMAGANYGRTIRRAEIIEIEADSAEVFREALNAHFKKHRSYQTIRRVGPVSSA